MKYQPKPAWDANDDLNLLATGADYKPAAWHCVDAGDAAAVGVCLLIAAFALATFLMPPDLAPLVAWLWQ